MILLHNPTAPSPEEMKTLVPGAGPNLLKAWAAAYVIKGIGFWALHVDPKKDYYKGKFPWPGDFLDLSWDAEERQKVVEYLLSQPKTAHYMGVSECRFCDTDCGSADQSDGTYVWPEGFAHYIEKHGVRPPAEFVHHVLGVSLD